MSTQNRDADTEIAPPSRFSYFGDEPTEGGVQSVRILPEGSALPRRSIVAAGAPGPEERLLDISELARTVGMHYTHPFAFPAGKENDYETVTPTIGVAKLTNSGAALLLTGNVSTTLRMECGRCLAPVDQIVEADLDEAFDMVTGNNAYNQEEIVVLDEDSPAAVVKGNILDLADLLRQSILLAAPLQPLCREDCPGIVLPSEGDAPAIAKAGAGANPDNPLKHLAELLEAKRRSEGS